MESLSNHPRVEMVARTSLKPNANNPRKHDAKQLAQLTQSLRRFGFKGALIVDDESNIVAGNALWEAAGACGFEDVPVIRVRFLSEADRRAFVLAHNRLGDLSEFDNELLARELEFLFENDYDFGGTGFDLGDLDFSISEPAAQEPAVELPDPTAAAISRLGDLWLIGPHRLYCGNAREAASYEALLGGERAAMIFCDPPYNVPISGHVSGLGKVRHREFAEASGEMTAPEFTAFLRAIFRNCARFSIDGSIHYHCMDWRHVREIIDAADGIYGEFKQLIVWKKGNASMGAFYRSQHELVFVFKAGTAKHVNNFGLGDTGRYRTNVWSYDGANTFRKGREEDLAAHPTIKSTAMVADAILDCSNRGDLILDPCSGSGTTLDAAHRTKRRGAAIEIDQLFVDTSLSRLRASTGFVPTLADGRPFEEVAADRLSGENEHG